MIRICHLFISPGHNFYGRQEQPAGEHPTIAMDQVECVTGRGLRGDRFFDYKANYKGQITFFSMEVLEALVDLVSPEYHALAGKAKDAAAGAVLIAAITAVLVAVFIFGNKIMLLIR